MPASEGPTQQGRDPGQASTERPGLPEDSSTHSAESTSSRPSGGTAGRSRSQGPPPAPRPTRGAQVLEHRGGPSLSAPMLVAPKVSIMGMSQGPCCKHTGRCLSPCGCQDRTPGPVSSPHPPALPHPAPGSPPEWLSS